MELVNTCGGYPHFNHGGQSIVKLRSPKSNDGPGDSLQRTVQLKLSRQINLKVNNFVILGFTPNDYFNQELRTYQVSTMRAKLCSIRDTSPAMMAVTAISILFSRIVVL